MMVESNLSPPRTQLSSRGMAIGEVTLPLLNVFQRLIDLLDEKIFQLLERSYFFLFSYALLAFSNLARTKLTTASYTASRSPAVSPSTSKTTSSRARRSGWWISSRIF